MGVGRKLHRLARGLSWHAADEDLVSFAKLLLDYSISRTGFCRAPNAETRITAAPAMANISLAFHSTAAPAAAIERGISPKAESMETLITRPRTARSTRCWNQAWIWTLMKPLRQPISIRRAATGQRPGSRPMHAVDTPRVELVTSS